FFGVLSIWHRQTPGLDDLGRSDYLGAGPGAGLILGTVAVVVLTFHWVRVVWSRTALQLAAEEQRRNAAAAAEERDRRRLTGEDATAAGPAHTSARDRLRHPGGSPRQRQHRLTTAPPGFENPGRRRPGWLGARGQRLLTAPSAASAHSRHCLACSRACSASRVRPAASALAACSSKWATFSLNCAARAMASGSVRRH